MAFGRSPMPPTYYIGLNVITKDDWDGIVTSYYRWTELALNLVFPIFLSGVVYCFVGEDERHVSRSRQEILAVDIARSRFPRMAHRRGQLWNLQKPGGEVYKRSAS